MRPNTNIILALVLALLISACSALTNIPVPVQTGIATPIVIPTEAISTEAAGEGNRQAAPPVTLDVNGLAQDVDSEVVPAVPPGANNPWWGMMPQYTLLTLQGYPITGHLLKPQVFVYRVEDLKAYESVASVAESLQALLQSQQAGQSLPYLPPYNAAQVLRARVKFLDFRNGKGVSFLTQYDQAILPVNNHELHYTFQGLTNDGKYYVSAVLPVNLPGLPADENVASNPPPGFMENFPKYLADTVDMLNQKAPGDYTPDLSMLDAMVQSLEIK